MPIGDSQLEQGTPLAIVGMACSLPDAGSLADFWHLICVGTPARTGSVVASSDALAAVIAAALADRDAAREYQQQAALRERRQANKTAALAVGPSFDVQQQPQFKRSSGPLRLLIAITDGITPFRTALDGEPLARLAGCDGCCIDQHGSCLQAFAAAAAALHEQRCDLAIVAARSQIPGAALATAAVVLKRTDAEAEPSYATLCGLHALGEGTQSEQRWRELYEHLGLEPERVSLLECGTDCAANAVEPLHSLFGSCDYPSVLVGAANPLHTNLGPVTTLASVIKSALALYHRALPPTLHGGALRLPARSRLYVRSKFSPWIAGLEAPRLAAVVVAERLTRAHLLLQEPPAQQQWVPRSLTPWSCELIALSAPTLAVLQATVEQLRTALEREPLPMLSDLAFTLAQRYVTRDPFRLTVAVRSVAELRQKLVRASSRLDTDNAANWADPSGLCYGCKPMPGKLAFLFSGVGFPGLSGSYADRLGELAVHFPELRWWLDASESTCREDEVPYPLAFQLYPPDDFDPNTLAKIEEELKWSQRAAIGTQVANLATFQIVRSLGLVPQAMTGFSLGEWSALVAAGFIDSQGIDEWRRSYESMADEILEPNHRGTWAMAGASAEQVAGVIESLDSVSVTLDVSANQCFIGGDLAGMDQALALLKAAGIWAMPMPSEGPMAAFSKFHTRHAKTFAHNTRLQLQSLKARPLEYPIYSSVNARLFPKDPQQIIDLIVDNSSKAVRLRDTVLTMYRDGFRVFLQLGGGGKILPTLEKILGLEPNVILSIDLEYVSGLQQFQNALARLMGMGQPVQPLGLFRSRSCRTLDLGLPALPRRSQLQAVLRPQRTTSPQRLAASMLAAHNAGIRPQRAGAANGSAPQEAAVRRAALVRPGANGTRASLRTSLTAARAARIGRVAEKAPTAVARTTATVPQKWPLVGDIQKLVPGEELQSVLTLDLTVHRFLVEHVLILVPDQLKPPSELLPTLPFTFGIEIICEVALTLLPGMRVAAVRDIEQVKFVALKSASTLNIWIKGRRASDSAVIVEFGMEGDTRAALRGAVELAREVPQLPPPGKFAPEHACPHDADWYYGEGPFFHGPLWRAVRKLVGMTAQTIHGQLRVTEQRDCFYPTAESTTTPPLAIDAVLLDAVAQMMGFREWCERQRFFVPIAVKRICFQDVPPPPAQVDAYIDWRELDARRIEGDFTVVDAAGRQVMRVEGWREWWVIWAKPFFQANHLSRHALLGSELSDVPEVLDACRVARAAFLDSDADFVARLYLTASEWQQYQQQPRFSWLLERVAIKDAVRTWYRTRRNRPLHPLEVCIDAASGTPLVVMPAGEALCISVAATEDEAVAVVAADCAVGVDLAVVKPREPSFVAMLLNAAEMSLLPQEQQLQWVHRAWVAKEAVCKVSGQDKAALDQVRLCRVHEDDGVLDITLAIDAQHGPAARTWQVLTRADTTAVLAIAWQPSGEPQQDVHSREVDEVAVAASTEPPPEYHPEFIEPVPTVLSLPEPQPIATDGVQLHDAVSSNGAESVARAAEPTPPAMPDVEPPLTALSKLQACADGLPSSISSVQRPPTMWSERLSWLQARSPGRTAVVDPLRCVLRVERLSKRFGAVTALEEATFNLGAGEILGVAGPRGSGKTTLLGSVLGRVEPDTGSVATFLSSHEARSNGQSAAAHVGWVPQQLAVYPFMSARENLLVFGRYHGIAGEALADRVELALQWADLADRAEDVLQTYSLGMMRRMNICIGALSEPPLVLMDEPTRGVDAQSCEHIHRMVRDLRARGTAILYTSHYLEEVERLCDRILILDRGRILYEGSGAELGAGSCGAAREVEIQSLPLSVEVRERLRQYGVSCEGNRILARIDVGTQLAALLEQLRHENVPIHDLIVRPAFTAPHGPSNGRLQP